MHLLLTDRLSCPRCGPAFGLILLAERMRDRRVLEGVLGCSNCRDRFPVREGFGDLRAPPRSELPSSGDAGVEPLAVPDAEAVMRVAALLGIAEGPGHAVLVGPVAGYAAGLADLVEGLELVGVTPMLRTDEERDGVSRIVARPGLPFFTGSLRGVVLSGRDGTRLLDEAIRAVSPLGRVVLLESDPEARQQARERMEAAGLQMILDEAGSAEALPALVTARRAAPGGRAGAGVALPVFPGPHSGNP